MTPKAGDIDKRLGAIEAAIAPAGKIHVVNWRLDPDPAGRLAELRRTAAAADYILQVVYTSKGFDDDSGK